MRLVRWLLRLALIALTMLVGLALMALALVTVVVLFAWSVLRGRKPAVDLSGLCRARKHMGGGDVVDVEVREVHEVHKGAVQTRRLTSSSGE